MAAAQSVSRPTLADQFLADPERERPFKPSTPDCYRGDLNQFADWLRARRGHAVQHGESEPLALLLDATSAEVAAFKEWMTTEKAYSSSTIGRKLGALRSFYKFLLKRGLVSASPAAAINAPRDKPVCTAVADSSAVAKVFEQVDTSTPRGLRDKALLMLGRELGLIPSELEGLNVSSFVAKDPPPHLLRVVGHSKEVREIELSADCAEALQAHINTGGADKGDRQDEALFLNKDGNRMSERSIRRRLEVHSLRAKLDKKISFRSMRRGCLAGAVGRGTGLDQLVGQFGFSRERATEVAKAFKAVHT